ncbi:hypothetical protein [Parahaliea aestuarii]|uniref:Uncharacterized protein n=1 Tax=Parahaliea aestuarii TaxID=1852021 RepID=A0A5C8ZXS1_9GAMM|nr:hypothetical protein [Parahaliea aestuarii]TXS93248.1 hypothetical protein FVW59_05235 [Parahaliea aestuarii]
MKKNTGERPPLHFWLRAPFSLCLLLSGTAGQAQDNSGIDFRELGQGYASLISFAAEPEISVSGFMIESDNPDDAIGRITWA